MKSPRTARQRKMLTNSTRTRRRFNPVALIGCGVTLLVVLIASAIFVLPRIASHADTALNMNCTLIVPSQPLSAKGLATPYQLVATNVADGACNEANAGQSAFVQGVIYNPATGAFSIYNPLVIDKGTTPVVAPTVPTLPRGAIVGIWFGFNATNLLLQGTNRNTLNQANCVNGLRGSLFTQFAYCNAVAFFQAANRGIASGKVHVPALQTANDGQVCPTVRDFSVIDQDQSDNVQTAYLANANGQTAQFTAANQAQIQNATTIANPSDNALVTNFIDPTLGCQPWQVPDLANANAPASALALDELQAAVDQKAPVALVPLNDPMTLINNNQSLQKTNLYRAGVDQPFARSNAGASGKTYCQNYVTTGLPRIQLDQATTSQAASPDPGAANSLFTFLAQRFMQSYVNLNCQALLNQPNPVTVQTDGNGVAISATITLGAGSTASGTATPAPTVAASSTVAPTVTATSTPAATPTVTATSTSTPTP